MATLARRVAVLPRAFTAHGRAFATTGSGLRAGATALGLAGPCGRAARSALPALGAVLPAQVRWGAPMRPHTQFAQHEMHGAQTMYATTILCVRKGDEVVVIGDGQVTQGSFVVKDNARKVRTLQGGKVITGFAGAAVDALALFDRLEGKLEQYPELMRAAVELAKEWRSDKSLRRALNAVLVVADKDVSLSISGACCNACAILGVRWWSCCRAALQAQLTQLPAWRCRQWRHFGADERRVWHWERRHICPVRRLGAH
jgi:hypothetical protein